MHTLSGVKRELHLLAVTLVAPMVMFACGSGTDARTDQTSTARDTTAPADSNRRGAEKAQVTIKVPELIAKIEDITTADFMKVIDSVSWKGSITERQCSDGGCGEEPGHKSTKVRHEAAAGSNDLVFANIPDNGVVVSRMQNLGKHPEKFYGLLNGKGDYYLILTRTNEPEKANLQIANLDFDRDGNPVLDLLPKIWTVRKCEPGHHDSAGAGFKDCPPRDPAAPLVNTFNRGAWFTCSLGCCTTEGVRGGPVRSKRAVSTRSDSSAGDSTTKQQTPR
jgi:hypothetical protein